QFEVGDALPVRGRNDRLTRRPGVSHRPAAPPYGNGHHHPLRAVGGVVAVPRGFWNANVEPQTASLVSGGMTRVATARTILDDNTASPDPRPDQRLLDTSPDT